MPHPVQTAPKLLEHFKSLEDPRSVHLVQHGLLDILGLSICAVIGGANTWVEIEAYGKAKEEWLKSFLGLANGIPSHDTIARVFAALKPEALQECFLSFCSSSPALYPLRMSVGKNARLLTTLL